MMGRLTACLVFAGIASAQAVHVPADPEIRKILTDRIDKYRQSVGIVVGVIEPEGRRIISYGRLAQNDPRPLNGDTVFEIGSVTKVFTSLLLADMVRRGEVALDDPVKKHLPPEAKMPERNGRQITLLDLSTHTSGLPRDLSNFRFSKWDDWEGDYSLDLLWQALASIELQHDIGSRYDYSNAGAVVLGIALANRTGLSYEDLVRQRIVQPLGLNSTGITLAPEMKGRLAGAHGYSLDPVPNMTLRIMAGAGGLRSTANDLLTLLAAQMRFSETALGPSLSSMLDVRRPRVPAAARIVTGAQDIHLGWHASEVKGMRVVWHNGSTLGYRSFVGFDPQTRRGVVVLSNSVKAPGMDDIGVHLLNPKSPLLGSKDLKPPKARKEIQLTEATLERYVGRYAFTPNDWIEVARSGAQLFVDGNEDPREPVYAEGPAKFFSKYFESEFEFKADRSGRTTELLWRGPGASKRYKRVD